MKKVGLFLVLSIAAFVGVLAALRLDKALDQPRVVDAPGFDSDIPIVEAQFPSGASGAAFDFKSAAKKIMPAVVSVDKSEQLQDWWTDRVAEVKTGTGSGVVISKDGYILTNNHVVAGASALTVRMADGRSFEAKLVGRDPRSDLAVIQIPANGLPVAELADSAKIEVGEWVMAVGNPLGYANTLSVGVVSSLNRTLSAGREGTLLVDAIQTDAAINSGNSGGALTNVQGQVIGINSAIASPTGANVGIGFAIPVNRAKRVVADIVKFGRVRYGYSGFDVYNGPLVLQDPRARRYIEANTGAQPPQNGLLIVELDPNSPAGKAGVRQLDVVTEADGKKVAEPADLLKILLDKKVGDKVSLKLWSAGSTKEVTLTLADSGASL